MKKFLFLLIIFTCSFMITSKNVFAESLTTVNFNFPQPAVDEHNSWLILLYQTPTGDYHARYYAFYNTYSQNTTPVDNSATNPTFQTILYSAYSSSMKFQFTTGDTTSGTAMWTTGWATGTSAISTPVHYTNTSQVTEYSYSGGTCVGIMYSSNIYIPDKSRVTVPVNNFTVNWASGGVSPSSINTIISYLRTIMSQDEDYYAEALVKLEEISVSNDKLNVKLANIYNLMETELGEIYTKLSSIDNELDQIDGKLDKVIEILESFIADDEAGEGEEVNKDSFTSQKDKEGALLNKGTASSNTSNVSVELDSTANGTIWSIAESFINSNALIMGFFITMLSLGVVRLILNR